MTNAITLFLSLSIYVLGLFMVLIALGEGNQSLVIAGWLVSALGVIHGVMSEFFQR